MSYIHVKSSFIYVFTKEKRMYSYCHTKELSVIRQGRYLLCLLCVSKIRILKNESAFIFYGLYCWYNLSEHLR